ncbi:MAG: hypothetical protein BWY24_00564 [Microgenomates group bacterium ADurb.Bin219]|nr:MAG: hypothetical protein BWY24_00564 [Microgenomates group bacterium ADurb.Bin219]
MEENIEQIQQIPVQNSGGPTPIVPPTVPPQKSSKILLIFLGVLIILAVGVAAFFLGKKSNNQRTVTPPAVSTISKPTLTSDPTANWKTYTNTKYGFEIKYYPELNPSEDNGEDKIINFSTGMANISHSQYGFSIRILAKSTTESLKEEIVNSLAKAPMPSKIESEEEKSFNNITWKKFNYKKFVTTDYYDMTTAVTINNQYSYEIVAAAGDIDQILSTFKFLSSDETANWKTYTNSVEKFSFKYPQSWFLKESSSMIQIFNYDVDKAPGRSYDPVRDGNLFKVEVFLDNKFSNLTEWFENEKNTPDQSNDLPKEFLNIKNIFVSSQEGLFFELKSSMTDSLVGVATFKLPQGSLVHFWGGLNYEGNKNYFDQILSTFKFLDQASDPTANWSVFTSKKGYSIRIPPNMKVVEAGFGSGRPEESAGIGIIETSAKEPLLSPHMVISVFTDSKTTLKQLAQENYDKNVNHPSNSIISVTESFREGKLGNNDSYQYSFKTKGLVTPDEEYFTQEGEYRFIWTQSGSKIYCLMVADTPTFNQILSTFKFN